MASTAGLRFAETHEWVRVEGNVATIGISDFAVKELTDLTYVELPAAGKALKAKQVFGVVVRQAADPEERQQPAAVGLHQLLQRRRGLRAALRDLQQPGDLARALLR